MGKSKIMMRKKVIMAVLSSTDISNNNNNNIVNDGTTKTFTKNKTNMNNDPMNIENCYQQTPTNQRHGGRHHHNNNNYNKHHGHVFPSSKHGTIAFLGAIAVDRTTGVAIGAIVVDGTGAIAGGGDYYSMIAKYDDSLEGCGSWKHPKDHHHRYHYPQHIGSNKIRRIIDENDYNDIDVDIITTTTTRKKNDHSMNRKRNIWNSTIKSGLYRCTSLSSYE
jgi:hypothetical protein